MEEYKEANAFSEVYTIINNFTKELRKKIPNEFIKMIEKNKNDSYIFEFDHNKPISQQNILEETKTILSIVYKEFLCSEEEKQELNKKMIENEMKITEQYNIEKILQYKKEQNKTIGKDTEVALVKYNESLLKKILKKLKSIFKINSKL